MSLAQLSLTDQVAHLRLDRPDKRNALSKELIADVTEKLHEAGRDDTRALLVTAEGPAFCAGGDIAWMEERVDDPPATRRALDQHLGPMLEELATFPAPTVAAVHGAAIGAGLGLALACDLVIAAEDAVMGATHTSLGLTPDGGTSYHLVRSLGPKRAMDLVLGERTFSGEQAYEWGLVSDAVPAQDVESEARSRVKMLAEGPTQAYRLARQLLRDAGEEPLAEMLRREAAAQEAVYETEDQTEGVTAFLEDREPDFQGR